MIRTNVRVAALLALAACRATPAAPTDLARRHADGVPEMIESVWTWREPAGTWRELFDGRTLAGWVTRGGRYDGDAAWTVEDGAITGRQSAAREGGLLYTSVPFADYTLALDVRADEPFDTGIFLHMTPAARGVQLTLDVRDGGEVGALYSDGFLLHNTWARKHWRAGDWNHVVVQTSERGGVIHATINGVTVAHWVRPAELTGFARSGLVGLQVHGGRDDPPRNAVQFKNVRVLEDAPSLSRSFDTDRDGKRWITPMGEVHGWRPLFDGATLSGWQHLGGKSGFAAEGGTIALLTEGDADVLATERDFTDFELLLEFKIDELANSGVFLRAARDGSNPAFSGCEIQVIDDVNWEAATKTTLEPWQHTGSLYGAVASGELPRAFVWPAGAVPDADERNARARAFADGWHTYDVLCLGPRIAVRLDGKLLYDVDTRTLTPEQGAPFTQRARSGYLGLQRHADRPRGAAYAWYRNVFVREL